MSTAKTLAAATALLASSCMGTSDPGDNLAAHRPPVQAVPAAAGPRPVSREVVFVPETPPALRPGPSADGGDGDRIVIRIGGGPKPVGAEPGPGDYDDGSFLPPIPPPPGVEPSTEEIPGDFLPGGFVEAGPAPADAAGPVFAEGEEEFPDGPFVEEVVEEETVVEIVEVPYYEVVEIPAVTTVTFGTPVLVMDGYRCWGWGRFPAVRSAPRHDPCAGPPRGAWWDCDYDPHWNPCYDPSYGSWERWDCARTPGNIYLDRDGDKYHAGGHGGGERDDRGRHGGGSRGGGGGGGPATVRIGGNRPPAPAAPPPMARVTPPEVDAAPRPSPAASPDRLPRAAGGRTGDDAGPGPAARFGSGERAVAPVEPASGPARTAPSLPPARLLPARPGRGGPSASRDGAGDRPAPSPEPVAERTPPARDRGLPFGAPPAARLEPESRREGRREPAVREPAREPDRAPRAVASDRPAAEPRSRPEPRARVEAPRRDPSPAPRAEPPRAAPDRPRAEPAPAPQPRTGGGGSFGGRGGAVEAPPPPPSRGRNR